MNAQLKVEGLSVYYGTVLALSDVSLQVGKGEIVAMIGPNGAGKTTALRAICGLLSNFGGRIVRGKVIFMDKIINGLPPHDLVRFGLCLVPQGRRIFTTMTVLENLEMGGYILKDKRKKREALERVFELFPPLKDRKKQMAGTLSGGEQQMLAIGRALMLEPELLLLDEPSLGLSPNYVEEVFEKIKEINKAGTSVLMVEQNARKVLECAHRAYVFDIGKIALEGRAEQLIEMPQVKEVFLGEA